jgi:hypothetical protein
MLFIRGWRLVSNSFGRKVRIGNEFVYRTDGDKLVCDKEESML